MAGRNPAAAVRAFLAPIGHALSCVTPVVPQADGYGEGGPFVLSLPGDGIVALTRANLTLAVTMRYRVDRTPDERDERGPWKVRTLAYYYRVRLSDGPELFAYHWHPDDREGSRVVPFPHLHVRGNDAVGRRLRKAHLPTGRVALEDVLELLIRDLGVESRRRDWRRVLAETRRAFVRYRTWPAP